MASFFRFLSSTESNSLFFSKMASVSFKNKDTITDDYTDPLDLDQKSSESIPKKTIKPNFDLVHPPTLEATLKQKEESERVKMKLEVAKEHRFKMISYFALGGSIALLFLMSFHKLLLAFKLPL